MAKIKTAREIALERIGQISLDDTERKKYQFITLLQKAQERVYQFVVNNADISALTQFIQKDSSQTPEEAKKAIVIKLTDYFNSKEKLDRVFIGLSSLGLTTSDMIKKQLIEILERSERSEQQNAKNLTTQVTQQLEKMGIRGSAVVAKTPSQKGNERTVQVDPGQTAHLIATMKRWCLQSLGYDWNPDREE